MPIEVPRIDDRSYEELLAEVMARIPVHNPEWTNSQQGDPGVTLLELFSFLGENLVYRSNFIPEAQAPKFLSSRGVRGSTEKDRWWLAWLIGAGLVSAAGLLSIWAARRRHCREKRSEDPPVPASV